MENETAKQLIEFIESHGGIASYHDVYIFSAAAQSVDEFEKALVVAIVANKLRIMKIPDAGYVMYIPKEAT